MNALNDMRAAPRSSSIRMGADLEAPVFGVEQQLAELQEALRANDPQALEAAASALHRCLAQAVDSFRTTARQGGQVPRPVRDRLALASARVAAQREALARATASLDRAIEVLMPAPSGVYESSGNAARLRNSGYATA